MDALRVIVEIVFWTVWSLGAVFAILLLTSLYGEVTIRLGKPRDPYHNR